MKTENNKYKFKQSQAIEYFNQGFTVIPLWVNQKKPVISWKDNKVESIDDIESLWGNHTPTRFKFRNEKEINGNPLFNIGIETGLEIKEGFKLIVIDLDLIKIKNTDGNKIVASDQEGNGIDQLKILELELGKLPSTPTQTTWSGGKQLFFKYKSSINIINSVNIKEHIDIRAEGGLVVVPPSMIDGKKYKWDNSLSQSKIPIAELPSKWEEFIIETTKNKARQDLIESFGKPDKLEKQRAIIRKLQNKNVKLLREGNIVELQELIFDEEHLKTIVNCGAELINFISRQSLHKLLGLPEGDFNCIFHEDNTPSATIFTNKDNVTGKEWDFYYCSGCETKGNIFKIIGLLTSKSSYRVRKMLEEIYNVQVIETEEQKELKEDIEAFRSEILNGITRINNPKLWNKIRHFTSQYLLMLDFAKENYIVLDENGDPCFYSDLRNLTDITGFKGTNLLNYKITHLSMLELIKRLGDNEIPEELKSILTKGKYGNRPSTFTIMRPTQERLELAEERQEQLNIIGMTSRSYTKEGITRAFGENISRRVYPTQKDFKTNRTDSISSDIATYVLQAIEDKGYCLKKDIIESELNGYTKSKIKRQLELSFAEILQTYNLEYRKLNKELKNDLNYIGNSYPNVIIKN